MICGEEVMVQSRVLNGIYSYTEMTIALYMDLEIGRKNDRNYESGRFDE